MNIIAVDDERHALNRIRKAIQSAAEDADVALFASAEDALQYAGKNRVDVAFLDIEMAGMNGLMLAKRLKEIYGATNIIFVTGHSKYGADAFGVRASGYVMKPVNPGHVARELQHLRDPVVLRDKGVRIQCFGHFEIFVDGTPLSFGRAKSKEVLAYLVDRRGASIGEREIAAILWEDEPYDRSKQKQLHIIIAEMLRSLKAAGASGLILNRRGLYAVDASGISCDYYDYMKGCAEAVNLYRGEYMTNYSWAEFTAGLLSDGK